MNPSYPTAPLVIFGGTFNPIHYGHLRAASEVREALGTVDFRLLPAGLPPHRERPAVQPEQRLQMLQLALQQHPDLQVDDREIKRQGPSYMVDTLTSYRQENPQRPLILVLGQDAANHLHRWHCWRQLFELCHLVIMTRPESHSSYTSEVAQQIQQRKTPSAVQLHHSGGGLVLPLPVTKLAISSTGIRSQIAAGKSPRFLLPDTVLGYIHRHQLYR